MGYWSSGNDGELSTLRHGFNSRIPRQGEKRDRDGASNKRNGAVVQLVRMLACHAGGRGFKSRPLRHMVRRDAKVAHESSKKK